MSSQKTKTKKPAPAKSGASKKSSASAGTARKQSAPTAEKAPAIATREIPFIRADLPIADIVPVYNAREEFDPAELQELTDSIQAIGVQNDLWVYKLPKPVKGAHYGLIAGERRWRASQATTRLLVPCKIYDCSAAEALQLGLVDNIQRAQLTEIEEAFAYKKLIDELKWKAWDPADPEHSLGHRLGRSKTKIYALLKLTELPKAGVDAVKKGLLSPSVGVRIARIPNPEARKKALAAAIQYRWTDDQAARDIERHYMTELKGAPFDRKDETLNPERGSCDKCPFRSGNQAELYPDMAKGRADICTDTACYRFKCEKSFERRAEKHRAVGGKVLSPKEAEQAGLRDHYSQIGGMYADLEENAWDLGVGNKTYRQLLAPALKDGTFVPTLAKANDGSGQHYELVLKDVARDFAKRLGIKLPSRSSSGGSNDYEKKHREEAARNKARVNHWLGEIAVGARLWALEIPDDNDPTSRLEQLFRGTIRWLIKNANVDALRHIAARRNLDRKAFVLKDEGPNAWLERAIQQLLDGCQSTAELAALQLELMAAPDWVPSEGRLSEKAIIVAETLGRPPAELEQAARQAAEDAELAKINGTAPADASWCDWSTLDDFSKAQVRRRFRDLADKVHARYAYAFGDKNKVLARRESAKELIAGGVGARPRPAPLLWEQLDRKSQKNLEQIYGARLDRSAQFIIEQGGCEMIPIAHAGTEDGPDELTENELEIDFVMDARKRGEFTTAQICEEFEVPFPVAQRISRIADERSQQPAPAAEREPVLI